MRTRYDYSSRSTTSTVRTSMYMSTYEYVRITRFPFGGDAREIRVRAARSLVEKHQYRAAPIVSTAAAAYLVYRVLREIPQHLLFTYQVCKIFRTVVPQVVHLWFLESKKKKLSVCLSDEHHTAVCPMSCRHLHELFLSSKSADGSCRSLCGMFG